MKGRLLTGGFSFESAFVNQADAVFPLRVPRVFNIFVENSVENRQSTILSDSPRDALTLCTEPSAGTFRVKPLVGALRARSKVRLDKLLVDRGLVASRERAQALILAGKVLVDDQKIEKAGAQVTEAAAIRLLGEDLKYVSRGGLKLERALEYWKIDVGGKVCLDVGASTGGFTDCLLQHGAARVIAIDTGYGQMDFKLRQNPHVRLLEKTNARYLTREVLDETVDFIAVDVSFISATLILPAVIRSGFPESATARHGRQLVVLVKPQFEAGREYVGKGGIVRDEAAQRGAVERVQTTLKSLGAGRTEVIESPILGAEGNREFLLYGVF
jgi:23S rRNA (cytidine1920-2'-O)/16S rRNA (cytidine1409-2'-O)-methyltransferase